MTPCVSGLSGPEGLVFGTGGPGLKNALFVAEKTANRISKVSPACVSSPYVSTGLSAPTALEISPGGPWGAVDTLYVSNGGSRVDQVTSNGAVIPFASNFANVDTIRFRGSTTAPSKRLNSVFMFISDSSAGTVSYAYAGYPTVSLQNNGCSLCSAGSTITLFSTITNQSPVDLPVEIKAGFRLLDGSPALFAPLLNNDRHFETVLPRGFIYQGPWVSVTLPSIPPGTYCYEIYLLEPDGGSSPYTSTNYCFNVIP